MKNIILAGLLLVSGFAFADSEENINIFGHSNGGVELKFDEMQETVGSGNFLSSFQGNAAWTYGLTQVQSTALGSGGLVGVGNSTSTGVTNILGLQHNIHVAPYTAVAPHIAVCVFGCK